jgi:hypothetical protein
VSRISSPVTLRCALAGKFQDACCTFGSNTVFQLLATIILTGSSNSACDGLAGSATLSETSVHLLICRAEPPRAQRRHRGISRAASRWKLEDGAAGGGRSRADPTKEMQYLGRHRCHVPIS